MTQLLPSQNPTLIGHDQAVRQVTEAFLSSRMHHAWLITGIEGIGKTTFAYHIANHVLSASSNKIGQLDLNHRVAKLIMAEAHPDMLVVKRATDDKTGELKNVIVVDDALKIASFLHKTSTHGGWRVVIIDEAHTLNRHGQNAILKILEEPPARVLILITATTPGVLLPTIRSRCRVLSLTSLDDAQMKTILTRTNPELLAKDIDRLVGFSGGSIGFALKIVRTETLPLYEELLNLISEKPKLDLTRLHKLADQIGRKADAESFDVIRALLLDYLRMSAKDEAMRGSPGRGADWKAELWDKVRTTFETADVSNLDRKLAFINAVSAIQKAAA